MIRNLQGERFINNKEKYYFPSSKSRLISFCTFSCPSTWGKNPAIHASLPDLTGLMIILP